MLVVVNWDRDLRNVYYIQTKYTVEGILKMYSTMVSLAFLFVLLTHGAQGLSCFCQKSRCKDPNLLKQECKGGLTDDVCLCCKTCAKVEGETCGGFWGFEGTCDEGLFCKGGHTWRMTKGICTRRATTTPTLATTEVIIQLYSSLRL